MKKGFTLIELLAVIVILAIIALIATPIVLNIIADTRENAKIRSAELYLTAIEQAIIRKKMSDTSFNPNNCYNEGNKIKCDGEELQLDIDGENPDYINVALENGKITTSIIEYENKYTVYENGEKTIKEETPVSCFKYIGNNCTINQEVCQNVYDGEYCESTCADIQSMKKILLFQVVC